MARIKAVVIDDSAFMRKYLRGLLEADGGFEIHVASQGREGLDIIRKVQPDVVTLDINMPVMDGLTCLSHIMTECPTRVVMVSSLTRAGELATLEALAMGAVDFIEKPGGTVSLNMDVISESLLKKLKAAARSKLRAMPKLQAVAPALPAAPPKVPVSAGPKHKGTADAGTGRFDLVVIGCSTGGPGALEAIIPELPETFPAPIIIAQHMPARFTASFAERMNARCPLTVQEVSRSLPLEPGTVSIGKGDADLVVSARPDGLIAMSVPHDPKCYWAPSVGRLVSSAMRARPATRLLAVMLTGMGDDGAQEMTELRAAGGHVIAESEETAVIFGMPGRLVELGGAQDVLPVHSIAARLNQLVTARPVGLRA